MAVGGSIDVADAKLPGGGSGGPSPDYTALLNTIITAIGTLDKDDDAAALATINASIQSSITELQAVNANTDTLEALLATSNAALTAIQNKLNESCAGTPINVEVCNPTAPTDLTNVEALLTTGNASLTSINTNTDTLEALATAGNASLAAINLNTDTLETLITNIFNKLNAACGASPVNVSVCQPTVKPTQTHLIPSGSNIAVPAGLKKVTITRISGTLVLTTPSGGSYQLGAAPLAGSITLEATEVPHAIAVLPGITITGGTYRWIGVSPVAEI